MDSCPRISQLLGGEVGVMREKERWLSLMSLVRALFGRRLLLK